MCGIVNISPNEPIYNNFAIAKGRDLYGLWRETGERGKKHGGIYFRRAYKEHH